jgi:hypothetical protein
VLGRSRRQGNGQTLQAQPLGVIEKWLQLPAYEITERDTLPVVGNDEVMRAREALHPLAQALRVVGDRRASSCGPPDNGLHQRKKVFGAVRKLPIERSDALLPLFATRQLITVIRKGAFGRKPKFKLVHD